MKRRVLLLPLALAACVAVVGTPPPGARPPLVTPPGLGPPAPPRPAWIVPGPGCDRSILDPARILGRRPEELGLRGLPFPVRVIRPGMAVTMDHSPARLNLELDESGRIRRYRCG